MSAIETQPPVQHRQYAQLMTNRSLLKYILLGIITLGIYQIWLTARTGEDLNMVASRYDGRRTMNYWLVALLVGPITLSIAYFVWEHNSSARRGRELERRGHRAIVQASDFWLWGSSVH